MNRKLFLLLSFTWGLPLSLVGLIAFLVFRIAGYKPKRHENALYFEVGNGWGGLELGWVFLCNKNPSTYIKNHELGHAYQNIILGPLFIVITMWSACRYWYREMCYKWYPNKSLPDYDSIWFEGWATRLGTKIYNRRIK